MAENNFKQNYANNKGFNNGYNRDNNKPKGEKIDFNFDLVNTKSLCELYTVKANEWAGKIAGSDGKVKSSQIRRFYDDFLLIYDKSKGRDVNYFEENIKPRISLLLAKVAYAKGRKLIDDNFYNFMSELIKKACQSQTTLDRAKNLFECFVGYAKSYNNN